MHVRTCDLQLGATIAPLLTRAQQQGRVASQCLIVVFYMFIYLFLFMQCRNSSLYL